MFSLTPSSRYYLYQRHVNMGNGINGLYNLVRSGMPGLSPVSGDVFVFFGKNRQSVKLLKWDGDGFLLYYRRNRGDAYFDVADVTRMLHFH